MADSLRDSETVSADAPSGGCGYPFLTKCVGGDLLTLVAYLPSEGALYEALPGNREDVNPEDGQMLRNPRSGERFVCSGLTEALEMADGDLYLGLVSADRWAEVRTELVEAGQGDVGRVQAFVDETGFDQYSVTDGSGGERAGESA